MNGAALPCGTIIRVEPSDPLYQLRQKKQMNYYGAASEDEQKDNDLEAPPNDDKESGEDEDLDDFFASLT
jgi:hypothetical protein